MNSNPDNIIHGLSDAIKHRFNVDFTAHKVQIPNGYVLVGNKICKHNQEIDDVYFGSDFYVKDGEFHKLDSNKQMMLGNGLILNLDTKKVTNLLDSGNAEADSVSNAFKKSVEDIFQGKKVRVGKKEDDGSKSIFADDVCVLKVLNGMIRFIKAPDAKAMILRDTHLEGDIDFSKVDHLELDGADLSKCTGVRYNPNASMVSVSPTTVLGGDVDFSNVKSLNFRCSSPDFSNITSFKMPPNFKMLDFTIKNANRIGGQLDLRAMSQVTIQNSDLSKADCLLNPNSPIITFDGVKGIHGDLNLENTQEIYLLRSDLSSLSNLKLNPTARTLRITDSTGLSGNFDFSNVRSLALEGLDLSKVQHLEFGNCPWAHLINCKNLKGDIDLSGCGEAAIYGTDFSQVTNLKLPANLNDTLNDIVAPNGVFDISQVNSGNLNFTNADLSRMTDLRMRNNLTSVNFTNAVMPTAGAHFNSAITWLNCEKADFSKVQDIQISGKVDNLKLSGARGLHGDLDFSNVGKLDLTNADLSKVHNIKFNPNGLVTGLGNRDKLKFTLVTGTQKLQQRFTNPDHQDGKLKSAIMSGLQKLKQRFSKNNDPSQFNQENHSM